MSHPRRLRFRVPAGATLAQSLRQQLADELDRELPARVVGQVAHVQIMAHGQRGELGRRRRRFEWPVARLRQVEREGRVVEVEEEAVCCAEIRSGDTLESVLVRALPVAVRRWTPPEGWEAARVAVRLRLARG